jgi:hypothetical protein
VPGPYSQPELEALDNNACTARTLHFNQVHVGAAQEHCKPNAYTALSVCQDKLRIRLGRPGGRALFATRTFTELVVATPFFLAHTLAIRIATDQL